MSGRHRASHNRHFRHRFAWRVLHRTVAVSAMLFLIAEVAAVSVSVLKPGRAQAAAAPKGQGFTVTAGDLHFIMKQIKIAERHSATLTASNPCGTLVGPGPDQIPDRLTPYGLRSVDGSCNNLFPARERFAAADELFPRLTSRKFRSADPVPAGFPGQPAVGTPTTYASKKGDVFDSSPRLASNLIVDQTPSNPAALASTIPVRAQDNTPSATPCTVEPTFDPTTGVQTTPGQPDGCVAKNQTLFIPNVTTDVGLSPPYNSWFTFFGQFFDHGVDQTVKSGATVFVPLRADDPLRDMPFGPDGRPNTGDEVHAGQNDFMVLTRARNQPGPDGVVGDNPATAADESADDIQEATNTDSPLVDQSQTYTSHASHQAFLREYVPKPAGRDGHLGDDPATVCQVEPTAAQPFGVPRGCNEALDDGSPVATGKLLGDSNRTPGIHGDTGMAPWAAVKRQAREQLGINLTDPDVVDQPMVATDPYGEYIPGPHGRPQLVTKGPDGKSNTADDVLLEGTAGTPRNVPDTVVRFDTPFIGDIAHNADPSPNPGSTAFKTADADTIVNDTTRPLANRNEYDDELLNTHFCAGDGRANENIALSAVHQIFHSEHDRLINDIKNTIRTDTTAQGVADRTDFWQAGVTDNLTNTGESWNGDRLFQAARFVTEMEYQHLVFEEFARKIQPAIRPFHVYHSDLNPNIPAEFAHAVYRFGHSMLDDDVARMTEDADGTKHDHSVKLLDAFLNPPEYFNSGTPGAPLTAEQAAGSIIMGSVDQTANELDEFVTETLRNNLLGLPLDLPTINLTRAREAGVPPLNEVRREINDQTNDAQMAPYVSWADFGQHLKHPESLINYVAAYGTHPTIQSATTYQAKRAAARAIVDPQPTDPVIADAANFMFSSGAYANTDDGRVTTGLEDVDLWVGGLGEVTNLFGGLLGSTFNYVFQNTLENLQDGDRFYYLNRTPGLNLRTQLEGNSFGELIERNTDGTHTLKADVFATSDCEFELSQLHGTASDFLTLGSTVANDPNTECDESLLLVRRSDGTIQYRTRNTIDPPGINGQSVYNGTAIVDRIFGGNDNDTLWGNGGADILDGQGGDDVVLGGDDNDIITDLDGADVLKGGDGNDAIDAGTGDDIIISGNGSDFTNGGSFDNETFGGPGVDFVNAGQGADAVFGDGGDDWIQGGSGQDLLQGDEGAFFFDDPGDRINPGNDIFVGQVGENDYDAEGGDDLMAQNSAIDRNAGTAGFDWAYHQYDTVGADDDMAINNNLVNNLPVVVNRDRWQETEADSGSPFNDIIRGDEETPSAAGGAGFTGCDALDTAGLNRITGLAAIVPSLAAPNADTGVIAAADVGRAEGMTCPLAGNVWGDGNILLGGGGGDVIEGRGGNDIIDGDRALHTRIVTANGLSTTLMEGKPVNATTLAPIAGGTFGPAGSSMNLQQAVFAGLIDPGTLRTVREIVPEGAGTDTAVFAGPQANYTITLNPDGSITVADNVGTDGTDTLRNVENLRFNGINGTDVPLAGTGVLAPPAGTVGTTVDFGDQQINTNGANRLFTLTNTGLRPLTLGGFSTGSVDFVTSNPAAGACGASLAPGASCSVNVAFTPKGTAAGIRTATLTATNNSGGVANSTQTIALTGNATAAPVNRPATGTPVVTPAAPRLAQALNAAMGTVVDLDGVRSVQFRWFRLAANATTFGTTPIATSTDTTAPFTATLTAGQQNVLCAAYKVGVIVTDNTGHVETELLSAPTARATTPGNQCTGQPAPTVAAARTAPVAVPLGQALAPLLSPAPLTAASVRVSASAAPLAIATTVPAGASTVAISVFRIGSLEKRTSVGSKRGVRTVHIGTVYRKAPKAKRYVFRLTEKPFRHLKPGRYLVQVRVGKSRTALGPATSRQVTVKRTRSKIAR
jgi:Ca2+-binding RTX toxin-like protein